MNSIYVRRRALAITAGLSFAGRMAAGFLVWAILSGNNVMAASIPRILVAFGDSLTAGYLLPQDKGFVPVLERELKARGQNVTVMNGGVSGDTTSDGLARLNWTIPDGTQGVILELGANDMLRGLDPAIPRANLRDMLAKLKERKIAVLLLGMKAQRNFGPSYVTAFDSLYPDLAREFKVPLYPFFLEGVAGEPALTLQDGLHPNAKGVEKIVSNILPYVEDFLASLQ